MIEVKLMEKIGKWIPIFILTLIVLVFSITTMFTPWWSIKTTREVELKYDAFASIEYRLNQASANLRIGNNSQGVCVPFQNLTGGQEQEALVSAFNMTFNLLVGGIVLTILSVIVIVISTFIKPVYKIATTTQIVAAILLLLAPLQLTYSSPAFFSNPSQTLIQMPSGWPNIQIKDFWGAIEMSSEKGVYFWIWGAAIGWYLAFISSMLLFITYVVTRSVREKVKKGSV